MSEPIDSAVFQFPEGFFDLPEADFGDPDYDYGTDEYGWPIPPPCIICGAYAATCVEDHFLPPAE